MPHYCGNASRIHDARRNNAAGSIRAFMQDKQRPIADWMKDVIKRHGISARAWAEQASMGKDTVSRAIREDYEHVTSTTTLAKLADAVGERPPGAAAGVPSVSSLQSILVVIHEAMMGGVRIEPGTSHALAEALRDTLLHLADEPPESDDPKVAQALARASVKSRARQLAS
jgi:hypothetical protein